MLTALVALALPLVGCGADKKQIPREDARKLVVVLQVAQRQADAHSCTTVENTLQSLERRVEALPSSTDEDVRSSLRDGIENLRSLIAGDCSQVKKEKPKTESTDTTTSEPTTTSDTTTETNPDTTTETTTETNPDTNTDTTPNTTPDNGNTTPEPPSGGSPPGKLKKKDKAK
jgi:hypothetical protein